MKIRLESQENSFKYIIDGESLNKEALSDKEFNEILEVNYRSPARMNAYLIPLLAKNGKIINK